MLALEREIAEAPHWSRRDYAAIFEVAGSDEGGESNVGVVRCLFTVWVEGDLRGFSVGSVWRGWSVEGAEALPRGELESVAVAEAARRKGIGQALCVAVLDWCREQGAERVELEVRAGSEGARMLYRELGFRETGRRRSYYSDPVEDALLMAWPVKIGGC